MCLLESVLQAKAYCIGQSVLYWPKRTVLAKAYFLPYVARRLES